jgi:hypothetical protein
MRLLFTAEIAVHILGMQIASVNGEHHAADPEEDV